ncbi:ABC transporter ATP-binding protein [Variovorax sp.]|jgi:branched-chain amino acid transport system ATP-binding protein|uniref:ABC transporter ATP-binding protein n=1 Tax=Variovorax sp. TaxID=1871043 RepID=UPI0037D9ED2D
MNAPALEIRHLAKSFGGLPVTQDVSLAIAQGERRLMLGPNGAGKTTLFNLIAGDLRSDAGEIRIFGQDVTTLRSDQRAQLGLARTFQIITLFDRDTVAQNLMLSLLGRSPLRWTAWRPMRPEAGFGERAQEALEMVGLQDAAQRRLGTLSYGEKRRVEIAMALVQRPRLLLLDEPLAGLSQGERVAIRQLLDRIPRETTVVMIEHDMDVALDFADRITLLHYGKILVEGTRAEVVNHPRTREIYLGQ